MWRAILSSLREVGSTALPGLRVVALVYTGLGGFVALFVVLAAGVMPTSPIIEQVTEPALHAVSSLVVQPTSDLVTSFISPPPPPIVLRPALQTPVPFVATISLDVTIDDVEDVPVEQPTAIPFAARAAARFVPTPAAVVEEQPIEDEDQDDVPAPAVPYQRGPADPVMVESPPVELHTASVEAPRPLPSPTPTLTAAQVKAQQEAENAAAIAANKAAQAQAKADADAANKAAIAALKVASTNDDTAMADAALTLPHVQPTVAPKAAADSAKAASATAKAQMEAGNKAAIEAARAAKSASQAAAAAAKAARH